MEHGLAGLEYRDMVTGGLVQSVFYMGAQGRKIVNLDVMKPKEN